MESTFSSNGASPDQTNRMRSFYQFHAKIYQATRWAFLFGREKLLRMLDIPLLSGQTILEVGCGTGHNLSLLAGRYPNLKLVGLDVSPDMLHVARKRLRRYASQVLFLEKPYARSSGSLELKPDVLVFSYCLTMFNPGWEDALERAWDDLDTEGRIAVVDFHGSPLGIFRRWMGFNHVRMDQHLLPALESRFTTVYREVCPAYGGLWTYFLYVGKKVTIQK